MTAAPPTKPDILKGPLPERDGPDLHVVHDDVLQDDGYLDALIEDEPDDGDGRQEGGRQDHHQGHEPVNRDDLRSVPLGRRMAREHLAGMFIYATALGWHQWDGTRWKSVEDDRDQSQMCAVAADWAESFIVAMIRSGADSRDVAAALRYREIGQVRHLLAGAKTERSIIVESNTLDAKPGLLNCANGTVDLRTGQLRGHDPADLLTKTTAVNYRPDATHPDWDKALTALPDAAAVDWVRRHLGSAASGEYDRSGPVAFHQGDGENGKSTVFTAVRTAFGDYAVKVPDKLLAGHLHDHDEIWMPLRGARLAYLEELPEDHHLPVARIKKLTETGEMDGRPIGGKRVWWRASHTLIVSTNYIPIVAESDHGTWRRLLLVSYPHTFRGDRRDPTLRMRVSRVKAIREAVLAWIISGAVDWYRDDMTLPPPPHSIATPTLTWRTDSDLIAGFLMQYLGITDNPDDRITTARLHEVFNENLPSGSRPWSLTKFASRIKGHHMVKDQTLGVDRGPRNRDQTALVGVVWKESAQGAQGHVGVFQ